MRSDREYRKLLRQVEILLSRPDYREHISKLISEVDNQSLAVLIDNLPDSRDKLIELIDSERYYEVLGLVNSHTLRNILAPLDSDKLTAHLHEAPIRIRKRLVSHIEEGRITAVSDKVSGKVKQELEKTVNHPRRSVGRLMSTSLVVLRSSSTVKDAFHEFRSHGLEVGTSHQVYVVDEGGNYLGLVPLTRLIVADGSDKLDEMMETNLPVLHPKTSQEHAARVFQRYDASELPVLEGDKLVGRVLLEDVFDVFEQNFHDQLSKFGGVSGEESIEMPAMPAAKRRLPWMIVNIFLDLIIILAIMPFEETIGQVTALAVLMPIVSDMGGNVGIQALTVSIRSLSQGKVAWRIVLRVLKKEMVVGLFNGAILGSIIGVIGLIGWGNPFLGLVVALALFINTITASITGGLLPVIMKKLGKDPALMSGAVLTTITDLTGFVTFLGLARILLPYLQ